jgi:hypothetical protein
LQEVIEQAGIQASGGTTQKASATFAITAGASITAVMEAGDWVQASTAFKHYIKDLPAGVKQRIHEQTVDNVQAKNLGTYRFESYFHQSSPNVVFSQKIKHSVENLTILES